MAKSIDDGGQKYPFNSVSNAPAHSVTVCVLCVVVYTTNYNAQLTEFLWERFIGWLFLWRLNIKYIYINIRSH